MKVEKNHDVVCEKILNTRFHVRDIHDSAQISPDEPSNLFNGSLHLHFLAALSNQHSHCFFRQFLVHRCAPDVSPDQRGLQKLDVEAKHERYGLYRLRR